MWRHWNEIKHITQQYHGDQLSNNGSHFFKSCRNTLNSWSKSKWEGNYIDCPSLKIMSPCYMKIMLLVFDKLNEDL